MTKRFGQAISYSPKERRCHTRRVPSPGPNVEPGSPRFSGQPVKRIGIRQFSLVKRMAFREPRPTNL
jgi:hypothetical protein